MGMYTELVCAFELQRGTPEAVIAILKAMAENPEDLKGMALPQHPLFETGRWNFMLRCDSYYFAGDTRSSVRYDDISKTHYATVRCNLKNYDNEIDKFIDWVSDYIAPRDEGKNGQFIGYKRYEEATEPTLIYVGEKESEEESAWGR